MVGKTAIVSQFLYDTFIGMYKETVDDMYQGEFDLGGCHLALNIQVKIFHRWKYFKILLWRTRAELMSMSSLPCWASPSSQPTGWSSSTPWRRAAASRRWWGSGASSSLTKELQCPLSWWATRRTCHEGSPRSWWRRGWGTTGSTATWSVAPRMTSTSPRYSGSFSSRQSPGQSRLSLALATINPRFCDRFDFSNPASCGGGFLPGTPFVMRRRQSLPQVRSNRLRCPQSSSAVLGSGFFSINKWGK